MAGREEPRLNVMERRIRNLENSLALEPGRVVTKIPKRAPRTVYPEDMRTSKNGCFYYLEYVCPVCGNESSTGWIHKKTYRLKDSGIYHLGIRCNRCGHEMDVKLVAR